MIHVVRLVILFASFFALAGRVISSPRLTSAVPNAIRVPIYSLFELTLDLDTSYANPFDPAQIDAGADFTSPHGRVVHVAAFLDQQFSRSRTASGDQILTEAGSPVWKIRFAPSEPGTWRYVVTARDSGGTVRLPVASLTATPSVNPGFVRLSNVNPRIFAFDNGKPFITVGENMCWGGRGQTFDYDGWLPKLGAASGNWVRIWSVPYHCGLEWSNAGWYKNKGYRGLGAYNLQNAWQLDKILDLAQASRVYCMLTIGYMSEFETHEGYFKGNVLWPSNPYNAANGGPCATASDFWTNPDARRLYRQRLRYIAARYGWRTNIQAWEFWNETNAPAPWVREMAQYLKGIGPFAGSPGDPFKHLITTTYGDDAVWKIPEVDWTQTHIYGVGDISDMASPIAKDALTFLSYGKPHQASEFGIDWHKADSPYDPDGKGVDMHNGIWAAALAGDAGSAMIWWWDSYVEPKNLYGQFLAPAKILSSIDWNSPAWRDARPAQACVDPVMVSGGIEKWSDVALFVQGGWGKAAATDYTIDPVKIDAGPAVPTILFSPGKPTYRLPLRFHVNYPVPGRFIVRVNEVSVRSNLRVLIDGQLAGAFEFDSNPPTDASIKPAYKSTRFEEEYKIYLATFDSDRAVDVPAGKHTIELDNSTGDWLSVSSYSFTNYRSSRYAHVRVLGLVGKENALLWVQNTDHNWRNVFEKNPIPVVTSARTVVHDLTPGKYRVEYIDTAAGEVFRVDHVRAKQPGGLGLNLPDLATDFAVRILRD